MDIKSCFLFVFSRIFETPSGIISAPDHNSFDDLKEKKGQFAPADNDKAATKMGSPQMSDKSDQVILPPPATVQSQNQSPTAERGGSSETGSRGFEPEGKKNLIRYQLVRPLSLLNGS